MSEAVILDDLSDLAAVELALGVLDGDERAAALRRMLAEPGFARDVETWRAHFAQLFDLWPEVAAPADGIARIDRALDPAPIAQPIPMVARGGGRLWPGVAAASSLIAASLLLFVLFRPAAPAPVAQKPVVVAQAPVPGPILVAAIAPSAPGEPVAAVYDPQSGNLKLTAAALADANRSAELWVIGGDGVPHSLGLLAGKGITVVALRAENRARLSAGAVLAVSLEPIGGSPTGSPTGPVVAKGALTQV